MSEQVTPGLRDFLLSFADDEHFIGQQHTEWIGVAPFLEEDLALASIGQDELGHAAMLYELVLDLDRGPDSDSEATDIEIDRLAYRRTDGEYRSCAFTEYPTTDWAEALVRHWIYDTFEAMRWDLVASSSYQPLANAAVRAGREETFHLRHADALIDTLSTNAEAISRLRTAVDVFLPMVGGLVGVTENEDDLVAAGVISAKSSSLHEPLRAAIAERFGIDHTDLGPTDSKPESELRRDSGRSEHFAPMISRMREVFDLDPTAIW